MLLNRFRDILRRDGAGAARAAATRLDADPKSRDELFYVPFEHMNLGAKLVIVGITPGPNQIALSYKTVQEGLDAGLSDAEVLAQAKSSGSFGGPQMRPNLVRMLRSFSFPALLRIEDTGELWGSAAALLHATSVVPHAAFRNRRPFAGSFDDVLGSPILKACFERDFAATLPLLSPEAIYVALGPTPLAALDWCAEHGMLRPEQVMGAFAHPSNSGGSQVAVYLSEKALEDLNPRDPVKRRAEWLMDAAARMRRAVAGRLPANGMRLGVPQPPQPSPACDVASVPPVRAKTPSTLVESEAGEGVSGLHAIVSRGPDKGAILRPHVQAGTHIVSTSRFEVDYIRLPLDQPLEPWLARGYSVRMSAPGRAPSLIAPASIRGRKRVS